MMTTSHGGVWWRCAVATYYDVNDGDNNDDNCDFGRLLRAATSGI